MRIEFIIGKADDPLGYRRWSVIYAQKCRRLHAELQTSPKTDWESKNSSNICDFATIHRCDFMLTLCESVVQDMAIFVMPSDTIKKVHGVSIRPFPGCENAAGKLS